MTANKQYSNPAKILHWLVAGLIVGQYVLAKLAEYAEEQQAVVNQLALLANHKSVGMTILLLAVIRLLVRRRFRPPELPSSMPQWQQTVSHISHWLLYGFLFALPITGWLMSSAKAYSVSWFNLFAFPDLVAPNEALAERLLAAHDLLAEALFVLALVHILAALKHHFFDKDEVLVRMSDKASWTLFAATALLCVLVLGRLFSGSTSEQVAPQANSASTTEFSASNLPLWEIDYNNSFIKFSGDQAGAPFTGEWQKWQANIQFDPDQLGKARFDVTIDPDSVFSNDEERDGYIRSADFFDVAQYSQATYRADRFAKTEQGFSSTGQLMMKGFTSDAILTFTVENNGDGLTLSGTAPIDRLVWNIGAGDWTDTSWVGQEVIVEVRVQAKLP